MDSFVSDLLQVNTEIKMASGDGKHQVLFVLGGPGAGKGTQCDLMVKEYKFGHLSAGDLLRAEMNRAGSKVGEEIANHIKNGTIVPVAVTCALLETAMNELRAKQGITTFLIDGFPRNADNLDGWNAAMTGKVDLRGVLVFECPDEVCVSRCLERGKSSGRADDNAETLHKRLRTHVEQTKPVIEHYAKDNLVAEINSNRDVDAVHVDVRAALARFGYK